MPAFGRLLAIVLLAVVGGIAAAQSPQPARLRGTITEVSDHGLIIATHDGQTVKVALTDGARISAVAPLDIGAIKPGSFIGTATIPGPRGELQSLEVVVFPEEMRGTGEGHYDWDLQPGSSMTNATVDAVVQSTDGRQLQLSYKGGSVKVVVPPDAPIVTFVPVERSDLKAGTSVFAPAVQAPDGSLSTSRVVIGRNGLKPPM